MALCSFDLPSYGQSKYETIYKVITNPNSLVQKESAKVAGKIAEKTRQAEINARRFHPALPLKIDTNKTKAYTRISNLPALSAAQQKKSKELNKKKELINVINRFCTYAKIDSQSCDVEDLSAFPLSDGQRKLSVHIEQELLEIGNGRDITVQRSDNEYIYVKIPSNVKKAVPSIMFMAHLDTTPEAPGGDICPLVHFNYSGQDIILP